MTAGKLANYRNPAANLFKKWKKIFSLIFCFKPQEIIEKLFSKIFTDTGSLLIISVLPNPVLSPVTGVLIDREKCYLLAERMCSLW